MPAMKRVKTNYPGVVYVEGTAADGKPERIYYIRYRRDRKLIEEKAGRQFQDRMTPAKAARIRADRIRGQATNKEQRQAEREAKEAETGRWTISRLWEAYKQDHPIKGIKTDESRFEKHLKPTFADQEPQDIIPLDVDRLRIRLLKKRSPQTVKNTLELLRRIVNYGSQRNLCAPLPFRIVMPKVDNIRTEALSSEQLSALIEAIDKDPDIQAANIMRMALFTGMRRSELFRLKWSDLDFERGFINIRGPKGGKSASIPMNRAAREILENHPKKKRSEFVFPGRGGGQRVDAKKGINRIKEAAGLPKDFRPLHGLRHVYASELASSGQVDMYTLQKLLTHKSPQMTQRYSHLRDESLKRAADLMVDIVTANGKKDKGAVKEN